MVDKNKFDDNKKVKVEEIREQYNKKLVKKSDSEVGDGSTYYSSVGTSSGN